MLKEDLHLLSKLMERLYQELKNKELWQLFYYVENRLVSLLAVMELRRIKINTDELVRFSEVLKVLFEELNLASKLPQKTKLAKTNVGNQTSTSESVLNQLVDFHPLPSIVLEHRQIQKLKSTYIDGMMSCVRDGYISTHWDQTSAATGRLSSYQPNVQAIPKTPVIITDYEDNFIIDFQQIELRILAHLSNDPSLLKIFQQNKNGDIFLELAAQWYVNIVSLSGCFHCISSDDSCCGKTSVSN
ncbi:hypothetical protein KUTeg_010654 [Tegillarca granosa]|uniref:DNA-directed DNA polymerase family A palm domain-containing protein n=1 Tax=Tegillarca granosa TaxID=220873 RepID=A0ABQ9F319_TEGGR|nr:hypothetical protein KUTeg_010654 [Tegillarca granosa]